jgi:hypothetical protein
VHIRELLWLTLNDQHMREPHHLEEIARVLEGGRECKLVIYSERIDEGFVMKFKELFGGNDRQGEARQRVYMSGMSYE